ncbi:hypothetical protein [Bernardetia sp.]|uniref:hypothetical protein n=1 Tax=Bernardetia sp. TaxID=1937974 RepID=UPI0025BA4035|nr:hypothetical protein [Bernardetia sp.]
MKTYITSDDDQIIKASSALDIVNQLKNGGRFTADQPPQEYIREFAERMKEYDGSQIRSDSVEHFVEDLLSIKYLKEISDLQK